jgi:hypothetical protein
MCFVCILATMFIPLNLAIPKLMITRKHDNSDQNTEGCLAATLDNEPACSENMVLFPTSTYRLSEWPNRQSYRIQVKQYDTILSLIDPSKLDSLTSIRMFLTSNKRNT